MKRIVANKDYVKGPYEKMRDLLTFMKEEGIPESDIFDYVLGEMSTEEATRILKEYCEICGVDPLDVDKER